MDVVEDLLLGQVDRLLDRAEAVLVGLAREPVELFLVVLLVHERRDGVDHLGEGGEAVAEAGRGEKRKKNKIHSLKYQN